MANLRKMWVDLGIESEFYYEEAFSNWQRHYWPDAHIGISGGRHNEEYHSIQISHLRTNKSLVFGG
jgi:hypothetical protein